MSDVNVLKMVKSKKPTKKHPVRKRKIVEPRYDFAHNPYKTFLRVPIERMESVLTEYILTLNPGKQKEIKTFYQLKSHFPWILVENFFQEFNDSDEHDISDFYHEYIQKPSVIYALEKMKKLLTIRKYIQSKKSPVQKVNQPLNVLIEKERQREREETGLIFLDVRNQPQFRQPQFVKSEILTIAESEYKRAPWMKRFVSKPVKGFALRQSNPFSTTSQIKIGWFRAKSGWYKIAPNRKFVPDSVAYILRDETLVIETEEMYKASHETLISKPNRQFDPPSIKTLDVIHSLVLENPILSSLLSNPKSDATMEQIVRNLPTTTNEDVSKALSYFLVFLQNLIVGRQIYISRVTNGQYKIDDLFTLTEYDMLPEVFLNPEVSHDQFRDQIAKRRKLIEDEFLKRLNRENSVFVRTSGRPLPPTIIGRQRVKLNESCLSEDVVFYVENDQLFCFDRSSIVGTTNPKTGQPFSKDFLKSLKKIRNSFNETLSEASKHVVGEYKSVELAPGLFSKLREEMELLKPLYCDQCNIEIFVPTYKSVHNKRKVMFCRKECFDAYKFK